MKPNSFMDKSIQPNNNSLKEALGKSYLYWEEIKTSLKKEYGKLNEEWKYYGVKGGWSLKTLLKKRNLFFFGARENYFVIVFIFGDKAVSAVKQSVLPKSLIEELVNAKNMLRGGFSP